MPFAPVPEILEELRQGRLVILVDDPGRENEGDFAMAAEFATPALINEMIRVGRGMVCLSLDAETCKRLDLTLQSSRNTAKLQTAFTVSIDAAEGITTGISAADRARTIRTVMRPDCRPEDLARPGHVHPLRAREGGVLVRAGHTEAIVDLCRLAGLRPGGVICEILKDDGSMARVPDLEVLAERMGIKMGSIEDLIHYRRRREVLVERQVETDLPTYFGNLRVHVYRSKVDGVDHLAFTRGLPEPGPNGVREPLDDPVLVRVHSECLTGDLLGSLLCDCGPQLRAALGAIGEADRGVVLYLRQEGRGIGLVSKLKAYHLQQSQGLDTVQANEALGLPADLREYGIGAQILRDLGVRRMRLLTNNPKKLAGLKGYGLSVEEQVPIEVAANPLNLKYLQTKREKLGHFLRLVAEGGPQDPAHGGDPPAEKHGE